MKFNNNSQRILRFFYKGRPTKAKETIAADCENHVKEINSVVGQTRTFSKVIQMVRIVTTCFKY